uniref:Uncharacterized protein n=1 Tax=Inoviridae sp. ct0MH15 TaxID=2825775 RepID=A0A8S5VFQ4_9VIRU|nr:MAG TPA: hypothetical protein [Inoviridae sp. ct0MH15]
MAKQRAPTATRTLRFGTPTAYAPQPHPINRNEKGLTLSGQPLTRTLRFVQTTASERDGLKTNAPCVTNYRFGQQGRATPALRKASVALRPSFPQSDRLGGAVTAHNIGSPGGILPASRSTTERRLPRSPAREAPRQEHAKKNREAQTPRHLLGKGQLNNFMAATITPITAAKAVAVVIFCSFFP